jgi:hypothetical protein
MHQRIKKGQKKPTALEAEQRGGFSVRPESPGKVGIHTWLKRRDFNRSI